MVYVVAPGYVLSIEASIAVFRGQGNGVRVANGEIDFSFSSFLGAVTHNSNRGGISTLTDIIWFAGFEKELRLCAY
jgi:hypothetical protein